MAIKLVLPQPVTVTFSPLIQAIKTLTCRKRHFIKTVQLLTKCLRILMENRNRIVKVHGVLFLSYICSPVCATNWVIRRIKLSVSQRNSTIRQIARAYEIYPFSVLPPDHTIRLRTDCTDYPGTELQQCGRDMAGGGHTAKLSYCIYL